MKRNPNTHIVNEGIQANTINAQVIAVGKNSKAILNQNSPESFTQLADAFTRLYEKISKMPDSPDKVVAENAVKALEVEAQKGEQAQEQVVEKWFNFLAQTAPDAFEVAVATFVNPIQGLGLAFQKVAKFASKSK